MLSLFDLVIVVMSLMVYVTGYFPRLNNLSFSTLLEHYFQALLCLCTVLSLFYVGVNPVDKGNALCMPSY